MSVQAEIELLERVLFRLGTTETDGQLETAVNKFLTPVLLKIMSPNESVRCKVMEVLTHLNKRLKSRPLVQLPVEALLRQYQETESTFLHNFSIIYVTMGFPRMSQSDQIKLAPFLLNCLEGKPENHQDKLLMLVLPLLESIEIPKDAEKRSSLLGLADKPFTKKQLLALLQDVLLLPYGVTSDAEVPPPGMSSYAFKRVIANGWKAEELENLKKGICRFLCSGVFPDQDVYTLLVLASADTRFSVATPAIAELSKVNTSLDWTDAEVSAPLYGLILGNGLKNPERKTSACSSRVRQKLLQYLLKSRGKGINTVRGIQVIFEALFGENTNQKCKVLALQFTKNLVRDGPPEIVGKISKVILSGISKLIGVASTETVEVQNAAYSAMAQLSRTCPQVVNKDLQFVVAYFDHLNQAPVELHDSIREALIAIAPAFKWDFSDEVSESPSTSTSTFVPNSNQTLLLAILREHAESKLIIVQNVTCTFLTVCFPEHYVPARYLLLLIAGERSSLRETITHQLYGASKKDHINYSYISTVDQNATVTEASEPQDVNQLSNEQRRVCLPSFKEMIEYVFEMSQKRLNTSAQRFVYGRATLAYSYEVYIEILDYLRLCLWYSAGIRSNPNTLKHAAKLNAYIRSNYESNDDNFIQKYSMLVKNILIAKRGNVELMCIYDLLNAELESLTKQCFDLMESFALALKDVSEYTRILVAQSVGILWAIGSSITEFNGYINNMISTLQQKQIEHRHGSLLALSHALHRKLIACRKSNTLNDQVIGEWSELKRAIVVLIESLKDQQHLIVSAAIKGISLIGSQIKLPLPERSNDDELPETASGSTSTGSSTYDADAQMDLDEPRPKTYSKAYIAQTVLQLLKSAHSRPKIKEEAAECLGKLAVGDGGYFAQGNLNAFLKMTKLTKDPALNIAIAQSIVLTIVGHEVSEEHSPATAQTEAINPHCDDKCLDEFLSTIIRMVGDPTPASRHSIGIWLLAIVKNCSKRAPIYSRKEVLQYAFTELLSDDSEFVQDVASRGLGLVFELSDQNNQSNLANSLLNQLLGGKREVKKVTADTKLFEEGVLGKTPTGGNITTYKELCSLASDLNKPEMIYQFMQLANDNAAWNSKLGAAFGLKSISKAAKDQMKPFLEKIVPRLYRYKYDPTPKIQHSMISIWDSIVSDSKGTVELYYWAIFDELVTNLTNVEWRQRIACCLAIRDIIKRNNGLRLRYHDRLRVNKAGPSCSSADNKMDVDEPADETQLDDHNNECDEPDLHRLWTQLFRVMDDVHEGTRLAAEGTAKQLSKICIVATSQENGKAAKIVAGTIMPIILDVGITHTVAEIRSLSMKTLAEVINSSGSMIKKHLPTLVPTLLKATGELEIPKLSYMSNQLAGANSEAQEMLDSMRAEGAKQHHSTETLTKCIQYIEMDSLETMTPSIVELMKTTVNMGTKIACAHFVCLVTVRFQKEMQPLVGKYLSACFGGLKDRNSVVRKYNASAIGHLCGIAKDQSIVRLLAKLTEFYFENQSNKGIPQTIMAINKRSSEVLKDYSGHILPLIFFAMHEVPITDDNRSTVELWKELWLDVSPGDAGIRMNLDSIIPMLEKSLDDPSWAIKAQSANAINTIATRLGRNLDHAERNRLINALLQSIGGRTFQGKENLLQALASLCDENIKNDDSKIHEQIIDAVMKECNKEEPIYRTHALKAIGDILEQLNEDRFEEVYNMIWYLIDKKDLASVTGDDEEKNLSSDERNKRAMIFITLKETVCETLGKAWPKDSVETQQKYQRMFVERCVQCLQNNTRPVQLALLVALGKFVERLKILEVAKAVDDATAATTAAEKKIKIDEDDGILEKVCKDILSAVVYVSAIPHTGLKKEALNIVLTLSNRLIEKKAAAELAMLKKMFDEILVTLQRDNAPEIKIRLKDIEDKLKSV